MPIPLLVLILEDKQSDAELSVLELRKSGFEPDWQRVETELDYINHLDSSLDLILADYFLPQLDGLRALQLLKQRELDIPFILISGTIGEDVAVESMRQGAADYLLKDRLTRLGPTVKNALEQKRLRDECKQRKLVEEERLRLLQETHQRAEELETLAEVASAMRDARTVEEMLPLFVRKAAEATGGAAGSIFLVEPETGDLVSRGWLAASDGWRFTNDAALTLRHRPGESITGRVAATGEIYITRDLRHDPVAIFLPGEAERLRAIHSGISLPLRTQERIVGVMHIWRHEDRGFGDTEVRLLTFIAEMAGNAFHRAALHEQTERDAVELALAYDATIEGWSKALELRDQETEGHTLRVTEMTLRLARVMGIGEDELVHVRRGVLLHDIGKIGVSDSILLKPDKLTDEEWALMKKHPQFAYDMLAPIAYLHPALDIPYCHHEKWDGSGYPRGLKGEEIPLVARIFAVVDVWDALTSDRPYRKAWFEEKVSEYIREQAGKHFDSQVVGAFLNLAEYIMYTGINFAPPGICRRSKVF